MKLLFAKIREDIKICDEEFLVVKLSTKQPEDELGPIIDKDSPNPCPLVERQWDFICASRDNKWEFSTLRHAKYSTKAILYQLHQHNEEFQKKVSALQQDSAGTKRQDDANVEEQHNATSESVVDEVLSRQSELGPNLLTQKPPQTLQRV